MFQFGGQELCGPHHQQLMEDIAAELHVSEWFRRRIKREMTRALDDTDWQLRQPVAGCGTQVYFVQRHQAVKIGYATDVRDRMKAIAAGSGIIPGMVAGPVKLLASFPGGRDREKSLHRRFAELRIGGEWFLLNAQLKGFIGAIES